MLPDAPSYHHFLTELKARIRQARLGAVVAANTHMIRLYWELGREILAKQATEGWGTKVIDTLSADLKAAFPDMRGLSPRNLKYMRAFAEAWPDWEIVQGSLAQISWYHNLALLHKVKDRNLALWYAQKAVEHGWTRDVMVHQIEGQLHLRSEIQGHNFNQTLPSPQSELAQQLFKDEYLFDFLATEAPLAERALEKRLVQSVTRFLLELGRGFAFVGRQYRLEVGEQEFFMDLLFYHLKLRCYVVVELKTQAFTPEYAGKLNFYLSAVDAQLKQPEDHPSIGLLLCKDKNRLVVEYALRDLNKPIGVASYRLQPNLPSELQEALPSETEIQQALEDLPNE
jgi:predicted nuclease of restriction endonuclease-like (RecB) superfamily